MLNKFEHIITYKGLSTRVSGVYTQRYMAANLTDVAIKARKGIKFGIFFLIFIAFMNLLWRTFLRIKPLLFPEPPPPPTVGFDILEPLPFPVPIEPLPQFEYKIETATGSLPVFPQSMPVYFIPKAIATLDSEDSAKAKSAAMGFSVGPTIFSSTIHRFKNPSYPSTLEMNIINGTFSISFNLAADPSPTLSPPPDANSAAQSAKNVLSKASILPEDLTVVGKPEFLSVEGQNLVNALALSEADFVKVNLFRKAFGEKGEYPSLPPSKNEANVWFIISGAKDEGRQVIAAEFHYFPIDETLVETYPIKTAAQAVNDLKEGRAHIANLGLNKDGKVTIRRIYLAYFDPNTSAQFYQPIIVFEGDREFAAYIPAISADYYKAAE